MNARAVDHSPAQTIVEISGWVVGGGLIAMVLFPLAIPILVLTAIAVLPLLLIPLAVALALAVVTVPFLLVRRLGRSARRFLRARPTAEQGRPESHSGPTVLPPASVGRS
jgi:hypothetical protein